MSELSDYLTAAGIMGYKPSEELVRIAKELERQLAETKALLAVRIQESNEWEALARDRQAEIEAMRPMVERYRWLRSNDQAPSITGIWYGDFALDKAIDEARKQP